MGDNFQESREEEGKLVRPLAYFLRRRMEVESQSGRWMKLKERLGCWGGLARTAMSVVEGDEDGEDDDRTVQGLNLNQTTPLQNGSDSAWVSLAMALTAERELRAVERPLRVSLMRLMEEAEGGVDEEGVMVCCVCMVRRKGAAFIPCGHTFCRACAREVWLARGSCPLCNRKILEILHIF